MPTQVELTFNDSIASGESTNGDIVVHYDTQTVTGTLNFVQNGNTYAATLSNYSYNSTTNVYTLTFATHGGNLTISYTGQEPSSFNTISYQHGTHGKTDTSTNAPVTSNPCYVTGTLIAAERGEVAVEALAAGDLVLTASGELRPVKWIGHRVIDCVGHRRPDLVRPYRISAGSLGEGLPRRDLLVSPDHCILARVPEEILVPAKCLENGATITQLDSDSVTYWHVELDSHDLLVAEGVAAESYLDTGNRASFRNGGGVATLHADFTPGSTDDYCRPFVDAGAKLRAVRTQLQARAEALGWRLRVVEAGLHLLVDGVVVEPRMNGAWAGFVVPAKAREVRLISGSFVPNHNSPERADRRRLGIMVREVAIIEANGRRHPVPFDHEAYGRGFHDIQGEAGAAYRWTDGDASLSPSLWAAFDVAFTLYVKHAVVPGAAWDPPEVTVPDQVLADAA